MVTELVAARQMIPWQSVLSWILMTQMLQHTVQWPKDLLTDMCFNICNEALQILGGYGCTQDFPVERLMRDARIASGCRGTNEIMKLVISEKYWRRGATLQIR